MSKAVQRKWCTFVNFSPYILRMETFTIWPNSKSFLNLMWLYFFFSKFDITTKNIERKTVTIPLYLIPKFIIYIYQVFQWNIDLINYILKTPRIKQFASEFRLFANYFLMDLCFSERISFFYEISLIFGNIYVKLVQGREIIRVMHWNRRCSFLVLSRSNGIKTSAIFH